MVERKNSTPIAHWRILWSSSWLLGWAVIFSFFVAVLSLTLPFFMLLVYDRVLNARSVETLTALMLLSAILIAGMGILDYARRRLLARFAARVQEKLEPHLLVLPPQNVTLGANKSLGTGDLDELRGFLHSPSLRHLIDALWLPIFIGVVFLLNPMIGWIAVSGLFVLGFVFTLGEVASSQRRREMKRASVRTKHVKSVLERAAQWLGGQVIGEGAKQKVLRSRASSRNMALYASDRSNAVDMILSTLRWFLSILVLGVAATLVLGNQLTVGGMIACIVLINKISFPYLDFLRSLPALHGAVSNWRTIGAQLEKSETLSTQTQPTLKNGVLIQWHNVGIRAVAGGDQILEDCSLSVKPGDIIEINGAPGSGKTLLCETMVWARRPARGAVLGLGRPFSSLSQKQFSQLVGYVPEIPLFLRETISANISGMDHVEYCEKVGKASMRADLHRRILNLPKGYKTQLDEVGRPLARGDRELLTLARALYHDPKVIVIDEPSDTIVEYFRGAGAPELHNFLEKGGAIVVAARSPLDIEVPVQRYLLRDGKLQNGAIHQLYQRDTQRDLAPVKESVSAVRVKA